MDRVNTICHIIVMFMSIAAAAAFTIYMNEIAARWDGKEQRSAAQHTQIKE